jgi:hypothetical protein
MRYQANGFIPVGNPPARRHMPCAANISVVKGDALHDNGSGYATNATTAFAATFLGIAAADCDNSSGDAGALDVEYYPVDLTTQYIVPVAANALITQTAVGTIVDLENNDDVDISDVTIAAGPGFFIDEIVADAAAVAANTYGYAIGHFAYVS